MMNKCNYCMYRNECIGELPGNDGKCMAFGMLYVRSGNFDLNLGRFKNQEKAAAHFQQIKAKLESEKGTGLIPVYVESGKGRRK